MKHKDSGNIDLGLENLIKGEGSVVTVSHTDDLQKSSAQEPLESLYSEGRLQELLKYVEPLYETSPLHKLWWIRVQRKTKAVPEILLEPLLEEVKALNDPSHQMLIAEIEREFSPQNFEPSMNYKRGELVSSIEDATTEQGEGFNEEPVRKRYPRAVLFLLGLCISAFVCLLLFPLRKDGEFSELPADLVSLKVIDPGLKRAEIGSFSSLLYDFEEKVQSVATTTVEVPTPEVQTPLPKVTVNTESPRAPEEQVEKSEYIKGEATERNENGDVYAETESTYEVVSNTYVYSRPTLSAPPITRLSRGAIVVGRQKMAGFLKIESSSGEKGFVLLQDVEEKIIKESDVKHRGLHVPKERVKPELYNDPFEKRATSSLGDDEDL